MKTIDDLLDNLPEKEEPQILVNIDYFSNMSTIELMKEHQMKYNITMHKLQVEIAKVLGISKCREGEIKKM